MFDILKEKILSNVWKFVVSEILPGLGIGLLAGWIAGILMKRKGSLLKYAIRGLIGSAVSNFILQAVYPGEVDMVFGFLCSILGACLVIIVYEKVFKL